ncbi:MAG TPA: sensor histidine kinase, partial [Actinomycetota bacterium]|nr:sensor histidine kinase [Actinomycetota bacterium]
MNTSAAVPARSAAPENRPGPVDLLVAIGAGILSTALIHLDPEGGARAPDALAYGLGIAAAAAVAFHRIRPAAVFGAVMGIHLVYHLVGYPGAGPFPALMVALFGLAAAGQRRNAIGAAVVVAATAQVVQVVREGTSVLSPTIIMPGVLAVASVLAGEAAHNRRRYLAEVAERLSRAQADREAETQRRLTEERLRIARELHDIMAHTITVITVQAGEALDALDQYPDQAREAVRNIRDASREAMSELRATVGVLRAAPEPGTERRPAPGMRDLAELVQTAEGGGLHADLQVQGEVRPLPAAVELTAYRIVQESLTNVIRHAGASRATVTVQYEPGVVTVQVEDDGGNPPAGAANGHGIRGMRERAEAVGGR